MNELTTSDLAKAILSARTLEELQANVREAMIERMQAPPPGAPANVPHDA